MPARKLVLASSSPFRKMLLERLQVPFETTNPDIDEQPREGETPSQLVERLAIEKARAVAADYPDALVIGSDQVAMHGEIIVGKPHSHENAVAQLRQASGSKVRLFTGLALLNTGTGEIQSTVVPYTIYFRELDEQTIEDYLRKDQPYNCAGSVRAESLGIALLERFEGDDPNALIGLPLISLVSMLRRQDYPLFN